MNENAKRIITIILLVFVGITVFVQISKNFRDVVQLKLPNGLNVIYTHATNRCPTCLKMEQYTRKLLEADFTHQLDTGTISFQDVDYEQPEAANFAHQFQVATASVLLVEVKNGEVIIGKNLVDEVWKLHTNEVAFKKMLKEQINALLEGKSIDIPQEIKDKK